MHQCGKAEVLIERLSGRWSCRAQGHVYHAKFNPPQKVESAISTALNFINATMINLKRWKNRIKVYESQRLLWLNIIKRRTCSWPLTGPFRLKSSLKKWSAEIKKVIKWVGNVRYRLKRQRNSKSCGLLDELNAEALQACVQVIKPGNTTADVTCGGRRSP